MDVLNVIDIKTLEFSFIVILCVTLYAVYTSCTCLYVTCVGILYVCLKFIRHKSAVRIKIKHQGVFITGCDTGIGHDVARRLDSLDFTVFAGCLYPDGEGAKKLKSESSKRLHIVPLDVASDESVLKAHDYVVKHLPKNGLWAIINNAGYNTRGDVECLTIDLYKKIMNVNYFGAIRTIRNFLYLVRRNKGRVVIVTSVRGRYSWPNNSAYHITKHGLETVGDCLRLEMLKFGVKVSLVEPGNFAHATACQSESHYKRYEEEADEMWKIANDDVRKTYTKKYFLYYARRKSSKSGNNATTKPVIDALEDAVVSGLPHTRYLVDGSWFDKDTTLARYYYYLPTWLSDWIITKMTGCDKFPDYSKMKLD
ncbi:(2R 3R)-2 [Mactra antiquata]